MSLAYLSHYAAWGAYASFVLGGPGKGGGFALSDVQSPGRNVYAAYRQGAGPVQVLPFLTQPTYGGEAAFVAGFEGGRDWHARQVRVVPDVELSRETRWATDTWRHGPLSLRFVTPFGPVAPPEDLSDDERRRVLCPAVFAVLELDNRGGESPAEVFFGLQGVTRSLARATAGQLLGVAGGRAWGLAARPGSGAQEVQDFDVLGAAFGERRPRVRPLGDGGGLLLSVAPGAVGRLEIALGTYQAGVVTSGLETRFAYTRDFARLEDVLAHAVAALPQALLVAEARDAELRSSGLSPDRQFLLAHATRGYLASAQLMTREDGRFLWAVNEGEYRMLNTLDLAVDQLFWELRWHPWTTANVLDLALERHSFTDDLQGDLPGGLSFTHDMGVANVFAEPGESAYETADLHGCYSHMTTEQLLNWTVCASIYGLKADPAWLLRRREVLLACLASLAGRDTDGDGLMDRDSARCGLGWEITTYDSLDASLGQARGSLYLAVKTWGALLCLGRALEEVGEQAACLEAQRLAELAGRRVAGAQTPSGTLPALLDDDLDARIIPAIEGLAYPLYLGLLGDFGGDGPHAPLLSALERHLRAVLVPGECLDPVSGGWKLSSSADNTWMSKIFLNQFVAERAFGLPADGQADAAHVRWQQVGSADSGPTDQVRSSDGAALGSRLYPRLVTGVLWLEGAQVKQPQEDTAALA